MLQVQTMTHPAGELCDWEWELAVSHTPKDGGGGGGSSPLYVSPVKCWVGLGGTSCAPACPDCTI